MTQMQFVVGRFVQMDWRTTSSRSSWPRSSTADAGLPVVRCLPAYKLPYKCHVEVGETVEVSSHESVSFIIQSSSEPSSPKPHLPPSAMVARVAAKKGSVWFADPSTYPLLAAMGAASILCLSTGVRHLTTSPDVKWDREVRKNPEMALKDRSEWRSHRKLISGLHSNAVNAYHDK